MGFSVRHNLNTLANTDNVDIISARINGSNPANLLNRRKKYFLRAKKVLGID